MYSLLLSFNFFLGAIKSKKPYLSRKAAVWKSSGKSKPVIYFTTLAPADAIKVTRSEMLIAPNIV